MWTKALHTQTLCQGHTADCRTTPLMITTDDQTKFSLYFSPFHHSLFISPQNLQYSQNHPVVCGHKLQCMQWQPHIWRHPAVFFIFVHYQNKFPPRFCNVCMP